MKSSVYLILMACLRDPCRWWP